VDQEGLGSRRARAPKDETIGLPPADNLHMAFEDADLVPQHQKLGLISGVVAEGCEGEVDEESEAGVNDEEEHERRLIVEEASGAALTGSAPKASNEPPGAYHRH